MLRYRPCHSHQTAALSNGSVQTKANEERPQKFQRAHGNRKNLSCGRCGYSCDRFSNKFSEFIKSSSLGLSRAYFSFVRSSRTSIPFYTQGKHLVYRKLLESESRSAYNFANSVLDRLDSTFMDAVENESHLIAAEYQFWDGEFNCGELTDAEDLTCETAQHRFQEKEGSLPETSAVRLISILFAGFE